MPSLQFQVRLYSKNHASCVGTGEVQDESEALNALYAWNSRLRLCNRRREPTRVLVKVTDVYVPAAFVLHKGAPPAPTSKASLATMEDVSDGNGMVLWDIAHLRRSSEWKAPPSVRHRRTPNDSSAYNDDADFFSTPERHHVVNPPGNSTFISLVRRSRYS